MKARAHASKPRSSTKALAIQAGQLQSCAGGLVPRPASLGWGPAWSPGVLAQRPRQNGGLRGLGPGQTALLLVGTESHSGKTGAK